MIALFQRLSNVLFVEFLVYVWTRRNYEDSNNLIGMIEELEKQTAEIKEAQNKVGKSYKVLIPFVIITMIVSLANLGIAIARIFGLF